MDVLCPSCSKTFRVNDDKAREHPIVRCECDNIINITQAVITSNLTRTIGQYEIIRRLGMGGMGEILLAKHAGAAGFERTICIKKMLPHLSQDTSFISMLIREAKLTVRLSHPNIVQVYDLGEENGEYYIAMEYIDGIDLGRMIDACIRKEIYPPIEVSVYILIQVLRGLHYAHSLTNTDGTPMGLIHRDMTPQNVLLSESGVVKITDFGIAKAAGQISSTRPGMVKGKLGYISPEQITGQDIDHRVDVFTSGILLWETLATQRLFKAVDLVDSFRMIAECKIPSIKEIRPLVSDELERVILRALTAQVHERFQTAGDFAKELERAMMPITIGELEDQTRNFFKSNADFFEIPIAANKKHEEQTRDITAGGQEEVDISKFPSIEVILDDGSGSPDTSSGSKTPSTTPVPSDEQTEAIVAAVERRITSQINQGRSSSRWLVVSGIFIVALLLLGGVLYAGGFINLSANQLEEKNIPPLSERIKAIEPTPPPKEIPEPKPEKPPVVKKRPRKKVRKKLSVADIRSTFVKKQGALTRCVERYKDEVIGGKASLKAKLTISLSGAVTDLEMQPPFDKSTKIGRCARNVIQSIKFPPHKGPPPTFIMPFEITTMTK